MTRRHYHTLDCVGTDCGRNVVTMDADRLARALDDHLPRMAFQMYGSFYNDDPAFDIEAYYRRVAAAIIADLEFAAAR